MTTFFCYSAMDIVVEAGSKAIIDTGVLLYINENNFIQLDSKHNALCVSSGVSIILLYSTLILLQSYN